MSQVRKDGASHNLWCEVCQTQLPTYAEYALHEFSKKHCDNLIKVSKNKPVGVKSKEQKPSKSCSEVQDKGDVPQTGTITKYGYFVPGEVTLHESGYAPREYDYNYDPYLQKLAENPFKEPKEQPKPTLAEQALNLPTVNVKSFSRKKKKKVRMCQICNVTLCTIPEYDTHMRSPQHIWKLKMSGTGVSAHFVKASTDLHTTEGSEDGDDAEGGTPEGTPSTQPTPGSSFQSHFCDVCDLLLNSEQQYQAHMNGKGHKDVVQKKADAAAKKLKNQTPLPDQLYCFSCKLILNNLHQYNEHKFGKKHKIKCKMLLREGVTIPPEERVPTLPIPRALLARAPVYPELYQKMIDDKAKCSAPTPPPPAPVAPRETPTVAANLISGMYHCENCNLKFGTISRYDLHLKSKEHLDSTVHILECKPCEIAFKTNGDFQEHVLSEDHLVREKGAEREIENTEESFVKPAIVFYKRPTSALNHDNHTLLGTEVGHVAEDTRQEASEAEESFTASENHCENLTCHICCEEFEYQGLLEMHLGTEEHARNVLELKSRGVTDDEILQTLYKDKEVTKPDANGRYTCAMCNVTSNNLIEYNQHLSCIVHKYTEKDFRRKKMIEVQQAVEADESGKYTCKVCKVSADSLLEYNQHLHTLTHKYTYKARKFAARRRALLEQGRFGSKWFVGGLKKNAAMSRCEKNPGVRTKVGGIATDLNTGAMAAVPNLEPLEPMIGPAKNVNIGLAVVTEGHKRPKAPKGPNKKSKPDFRDPRPLFHHNMPFRGRPPVPWNGPRMMGPQDFAPYGPRPLMTDFRYSPGGFPRFHRPPWQGGYPPY